MAKFQGGGFQCHVRQNCWRSCENIDSCIPLPEFLNLSGAEAFAFVTGT